MFITDRELKKGSWQAFERAISRLLLSEGFDSVRLIGQTGDHGADLLANKYGKRWLFQVKHWNKTVGVETVDKTLEALKIYRAQIPVIVSLNGFEDTVQEHQRVLMSRRIPLQLWDRAQMVKRAKKLPNGFIQKLSVKPRQYQEEAIRILLKTHQNCSHNKALVVMATGLGKTITVCETIRRIFVSENKQIRVLFLVHVNELVYQFERALWPFLTTEQKTIVWNGYEKPDEYALNNIPYVFACINSVEEYLAKGKHLPYFDIIVVDECHHVGGSMYEIVLNELNAGKKDGPFLIGLTATPWRSDEVNLIDYFGDPLVTVDIITGLKNGFLSNVDYRMYTDNINWEALSELHGSSFSPRKINRTLFINQWDDSVVYELQKAWKEQTKPRAIVFCGTIDHAIIMRDRINSLGFCNAAAIYSQTSAGKKMEAYERNCTLCDFSDGVIDVICAVDILNEGIDVPDVNIIVFQRVTHSRRIFVQQLGRGLRISPEKEKVIVLDFVSDIRRFAAGIDLKDSLENNEPPRLGEPVRINLPHKVTFRRVGSEDPETESFLRNWLQDVTEIENAGEDASVLKFPPEIPRGKI